MSKKLVIIICSLLLIAMSISAEVPNTINYQGRLTDSSGDPVADDSYLIKFIIWDAAVGGTELWTSNFQLVSTLNGLFTYEIGSVSSLPLNIFDDSSRYLGTTIGTDAELMPRSKLNSVPYARSIVASTYVNETGDTMSGNLWINNGSGIGTVNLTGNDGGLWVYGLSDGDVRASLSSNPWGRLRMYDNAGNNTVQIEANDTDGGVLVLYDPIGDEDIILATSTIGNATVTLPNNAIDNIEILDEPGIASNSYVGYITLTNTMQDVVTVSITTPGPGYIYVTGRCWTASSGKTGYNAVATQIDETAGGAEDPNHYTFSGPQYAVSTSASELHSVYTDRPYYKSTGGTYIFRLEALRSSATGTANAGDARITATYYPTSYGSVSTISPQPPTGTDAELITTTNLDGSTSQVYKYDLRDLELKAKAAALKLKEAELKLLKAQHQQKRTEQ